MANGHNSTTLMGLGVDAPAVPRAPIPAENVFRSTDLDQTRAAISKVFSPHKLDVVSRGSRIDAALATWEVGSVKVAYVRHGAEVVVRPGRLGSYFVVNIPLRGSTLSRCGDTAAQSDQRSAIVLSPTHETVMHWSEDCEQVCLRIDRSILESELSRMLRRDVDAPVMFDVALSLSTRGGSSWAATVRFVLDELRHASPSLCQPLVQSRFEQLIVDQLLLVQAHNYSEQLETGHLPARSPTVRRAIEIINDRAAEALTVPMLAELVGASVRSLQQGFHDHLGTSPLEYLRDVRLARAHDDLLAADPHDPTSVTEVAYRWGFAHLPRFAHYYKHRYGELPSQTLRRR